MRFKKVGADSPEIILTFKFETSTSVENFSRYADYTDRESAVMVENVEKAFEEHLDPEPDFEKMIGYMKRDTAVVNMDERRTGLFTENSNNITVDEMEELKNKLNEAQLNGNNLWNPVVSFDVEYMIRVGILKYNPELEFKIDHLDKIFKAAEKEKPKNPKKIYQAKKELELAAKQREVDQDRLKSVIQSNMGKFLKAEGFDETAFWWGSVHLNTKHIHVHISFSELKNSRKLMNVEKKIDGEIRQLKEPRGKLKEKSIKRLKSNLYRSLEIDENRAERIMKEKEVGFHRCAIFEKMKDFPKSKNSLLNFYIRQTFENLPEDKKWNYKSNRKEFQKSKSYLTAFVEEYLRTDAKDEYEAFTQATRNQLRDYESVYSKKENFDLEKSVAKRQQVLKEEIANRVLKQLKNHHIEKNKYGEDFEFLNSKELEQVVEDLKQTKLPSKELGQYKWQLRVSYAETEEQYFISESRNMDKFEDLEGNARLKNFAKQSFSEQIDLARLNQISAYQLSKSDEDKKRQLSLKYSSARKLPIDKLTDSLLEQKLYQINLEQDIIKQTKDKAIIKAIYHSGVKQAIKHLEDEKRILLIKSQIGKNNRSQNQSQNRALFQELKKIYGEQQQIKKFDGEKNQYKIFRLKRPVRKKQNRTSQMKKRHLTSKSFRHSLQKMADENEKMFQSLSAFSNYDAKRAERLKQRSDDEEEREI